MLIKQDVIYFYKKNNEFIHLKMHILYITVQYNIYVYIKESEHYQNQLYPGDYICSKSYKLWFLNVLKENWLNFFFQSNVWHLFKIILYIQAPPFPPLFISIMILLSLKNIFIY